MILQLPDVPDGGEAIEALDRSRAMTFFLELLARIPEWLWVCIVVFVMAYFLIKVWRKR